MQAWWSVNPKLLHNCGHLAAGTVEDGAQLPAKQRSQQGTHGAGTALATPLVQLSSAQGFPKGCYIMQDVVSYPQKRALKGASEYRYTKGLVPWYSRAAQPGTAAQSARRAGGAGTALSHGSCPAGLRARQGPRKLEDV